MSLHLPAVFSISSSAPFMDTLASFLLKDAVDKRCCLSEYLILLPNRRACRTLNETFLRLNQNRALLLPRMMPLGDLESDDDFFSSEPETHRFDLPQAVPALTRQAHLMNLILTKHTNLGGHNLEIIQAAKLAKELGRFIDQVEWEGLSFDRLNTLVPDEYAKHWQITLDFLKIVTQNWPETLAKEKRIDPSSRRRKRLESYAKLWQQPPPSHPVIIAGSTGTIPATAELMQVIAGLPQGKVILPGLDPYLSDEQWQALEETHPQYGLAKLLDKFSLTRNEVSNLPGCSLKKNPSAQAREQLISRAMQPALATEWNLDEAIARQALQGWARIDCAGLQEEATVIALLMRYALETPGKTIALITPDRNLAQRVNAELSRWDLRADDSAGPLPAETPQGLFLLLTAKFLANPDDPIALLAMLKHPYCCGSLDQTIFQDLVARLECDYLRRSSPLNGLENIHKALKREDQNIADYIKKLIGYQRCYPQETSHIRECLQPHLESIEFLLGSKGSDFFSDEADTIAVKMLQDIAISHEDFPPFHPKDYPLLLRELMQPYILRRDHGFHPCLSIWGALEARMQSADVVILGGLNENIWPPELQADPWLSRPMRCQFGLPLPERRIGLSAHDFTQAFCAPEVIMTRSSRMNGTPTVPSRWLLRLDTVLKACGLENQLDRGHEWIHWQNAIDQPLEVKSATQPAPTPPFKARPRALSVTQIETWMRDPYALYAQKILKLKPLQPLEREFDAAVRGTLTHKILEQYLCSNPDIFAENAAQSLYDLGQDILDQSLPATMMINFWQSRFKRIAQWFIATERRRSFEVKKTFTEISGQLTLSVRSGDFTLKAKADRIDIHHDNNVSIIDYKTGLIPHLSEIKEGFSPQLPLEAAIALGGGFANVPGTAPNIHNLSFWRLTGGTPAGLIENLKTDPKDIAQTALEGLMALIEKFDDPQVPYLSEPRPGKGLRFNTYEHLARVQEWSRQIQIQREDE